MTQLYNFFFCLISIIPHYSIPTLQCESIQINHFHDLDGKIVFDQLLFMQKTQVDHEYKDVVIGWMLLRNSRAIDVDKKKEWEADKKNEGLPYIPTYINHLHITDKSILWNTTTEETIRIKFKNIVYETWTQYDPELLSREVYPKELYIKPQDYHFFSR